MKHCHTIQRTFKSNSTQLVADFIEVSNVEADIYLQVDEDCNSFNCVKARTNTTNVWLKFTPPHSTERLIALNNMRVITVTVFIQITILTDGIHLSQGLKMKLQLKKTLVKQAKKHW